MVIDTVSLELSKVLSSYDLTRDSLLYGAKEFLLDSSLFSEIPAIDPAFASKKVYYVDGGQAEILFGGSFCVTFIRVAAVGFEGTKKVDLQKHEFYLLTYAEPRANDLVYVSKVFGDGAPLVSEEDLIVSSQDEHLRSGLQRAAISTVANMARRFAELAVAKQISQNLGDEGFVVLDGTLQPSFTGEEKLIDSFTDNVFALAKTNQLFTRLGNNPCIFIGTYAKKWRISSPWRYLIDQRMSFVTLHPHSAHIFRFEGKGDVELVLSLLVPLSSDPIFLGYPYGLVFVDKVARISEIEKKSLKVKFLLQAGKNAGQLSMYLATNDAHSILDSIG